MLHRYHIYATHLAFLFVLGMFLAAVVSGGSGAGVAYLIRPFTLTIVAWLVIVRIVVLVRTLHRGA